MAQYDLGTFYYNGSWVNQNREEAFLTMDMLLLNFQSAFVISKATVQIGTLQKRLSICASLQSKGILKQCSIMAVWSWRELV